MEVANSETGHARCQADQSAFCIRWCEKHSKDYHQREKHVQVTVMGWAPHMARNTEQVSGFTAPMPTARRQSAVITRRRRSCDARKHEEGGCAPKVFLPRQIRSLAPQESSQLPPSTVEEGVGGSDFKAARRLLLADLTWQEESQHLGTFHLGCNKGGGCGQGSRESPGKIRSLIRRQAVSQQHAQHLRSWLTTEESAWQPHQAPQSPRWGS